MIFQLKKDSSGLIVFKLTKSKKILFLFKNCFSESISIVESE